MALREEVDAAAAAHLNFSAKLEKQQAWADFLCIIKLEPGRRRVGHNGSLSPATFLKMGGRVRGTLLKRVAGEARGLATLSLSVRFD